MIPFQFGCLAMTPVGSQADWVEQARRAEARGFATLQVSDHFDRTPLPPLIALAAAAQVTSSIRLGTLVLDNDFRHPAVLAKEIAGLDVLSGGRVEIGLSAGWLDGDYEVSGIAKDRPGVRIARLSQAVQIIKAVLAEAGPATLDTGHYAVRGLVSTPPAVQQPHPPLLLGGGAPRMLTLAAREADIVGVNMRNDEGRSGPVAARSAYRDAIDEKVTFVRDVAGQHGRDPLLHVIAYWAEVTEHPREALERKIAQLGIPVNADDIVDSPHCLVGPLNALIERLAEMRERWGVSYVTVYERDSASIAPLLAALAQP